MIECLILGDSIAVGVGSYRPECITVAHVGITSRAYVSRYGSFPDAQSVVISLGSNDGNVSIIKDITTLRMGITAKKVYWLLSANNKKAADEVRAVAKAFGDFIIRVDSVWNDGVHPSGRGYAQLAAEAD